MPPVVATVATIAANVGGAILGASVGASIYMGVNVVGMALLKGAVGYAINSLGSALTKRKPDAYTSQSGGSGSGAAAQPRTITVRQSAAARRVVYGRAKVGGVLNYLYVQPSDKDWLLYGVMLCDGPVEQIETIYFGDQALAFADTSGSIWDTDTSERLNGYLYAEVFLGTTAQAASTYFISKSEGIYTSDHRLRGIAYLALALRHDPAKFPNGVENVSALVKGKQIYDPRTATTAWSANAVLCIRDFLTDPDGGNEPVDSIDDDNFSAEANICDEDVPLAAGGTEKRYTCNTVVYRDQSRREILRHLLSSCAGKLVKQGGKWRIFVGAERTPEATPLTIADLRAPIEWASSTPRRQSVNRVRGLYQGAATKYEPADYPPLISTALTAADGGKERWLDLDLPATDSTATAQRIAKLQLLRLRQAMTITLRCKLTAFRLRAGDWVGFTYARFGWTEKLFEVDTWSLVVDRDKNGMPYLGVDLLLREIDDSVFDWDTSEEQSVDPAPNTNLPQPWYVAAPGAVALGEEHYATRDGPQTRLTIAWVASAGPYVASYDVQVIAPDERDWASIASTESLSTSVEAADIGAWSVRVRARNTIGAGSAWVSAARTVAGPVAPAAPGVPAISEELYITRDGSGVKTRLNAAWAASPTDTVIGYEAQAKAPDDTEWLALSLAGDLTAGRDDVQPGVWSVRVRAVDAIGVYSAWAQASAELYGLSAAPAPLSSLSLQGLSGLAVLRWTQHSALDVRVGGRIDFRFVASGITATWENGISLGTALGADISVVLPLAQGTYIARVFDSSGVRSTADTAVASFGGQITNFTGTSTVTEETAFAGVHSGTIVEAGVLKIVGAGSFDAVPSVDALPDIDSYGGIASEGVYSFANAIDMGADTRVRLFTSINSAVTTVLSRVDSRPGEIDDWEDWDGGRPGGGDATVEVRAKRVADGAFGDWNAIFVGDYNARWFEFRTRLSAADPASNILVSHLSVTARTAA